MKRYRHILSIYNLFIAPALSVGAICHAATSEPVDTLPDLEVIARPLEKSITSATPYHRIDSEEMLHTGVTDIADALRRMPGINIRDYGGAGGLKTASVRGLGAAHTGVEYNGMPLSDLRSGEIDLSRYSLDHIETIALTTGDNSDIFLPARNAASASLISLTSTTDPAGWQQSRLLTAQMRIASFGTFNPFLRLGYSNMSDLAMTATGEFTHGNNDYPFTLKNGSLITRERRTHSRMNSGHGEINAIWQPRPGASLDATVYYYDNDRQLPGPVIYYLEETNENLHDRNFFGQTRYRTRLSSIFSILGVAKFNWSNSRYTDRNGRYPGGVLDQNFYQREVFGGGALLVTPFPGFAANYSADWTFNNLNSNLPTDSHPYRNAILQSLTAKYSVTSLTIMARGIFALYLDNAAGHEKTRKSSRLSPSLSLSWRPSVDIPLFVRGAYKNIFRMPTFNELYFDNYGSVNLEPEITDQLNIGLTFDNNGMGWPIEIAVTADGYYNSVSNKIVAIPYNLFKWTMTNLGKVRILGADITINGSYEILRRHTLLLSGSYSYQRAAPRTSPDRADWMKQVAYTPLNSGSASLSWLNPWVSVALHTTGSSARYTTNTNLPSTRVAGYMDAGLTLFHTFPIRRSSLEIRGDIINIFNKQYEIVARYPMPGRSWQLSLKFEL